MEEATSRPSFSGLAPRDRGFAHALVLATLRHLGPIDRALDARLAKASAGGQYPAAGRGPGLRPENPGLRRRGHKRRPRRRRSRNSALQRPRQRGPSGADAELPNLTDPEALAPPWLFARWQRPSAPARPAPSALQIASEPATDLTARDPSASPPAESRSRSCPAGPGALPCAATSPPGPAIPNRLLVGAGRGGGAAGAAAARRAGRAHPRHVRRARRQDRAARAGARSGHGARSLGRAPEAARRQSPAGAAHADIAVGDAQFSGAAVRRDPGRRALLGDRHDPPPSRCRLDQEAREISTRSPRCNRKCSTAPRRCCGRAGAWSIAPARWSRRRARPRSRGSWPGMAIFTPRPRSRPARGGVRRPPCGASRTGTLRNLPDLIGRRRGDGRLLGLPASGGTAGLGGWARGVSAR